MNAQGQQKAACEGFSPGVVQGVCPVPLIEAGGPPGRLRFLRLPAQVQRARLLIAAQAGTGRADGLAGYSCRLSPTWRWRCCGATGGVRAIGFAGAAGARNRFPGIVGSAQVKRCQHKPAKSQAKKACPAFHDKFVNTRDADLDADATPAVYQRSYCSIQDRSCGRQWISIFAALWRHGEKEICP